MQRSPLRADLLLLLVAAIWGSGFIAQRVAARSMGPLSFNAIRYLIGFAILGVLLASLAAAWALEISPALMAAGLRTFDREAPIAHAPSATRMPQRNIHGIAPSPRSATG